MSIFSKYFFLCEGSNSAFDMREVSNWYFDNYADYKWMVCFKNGKGVSLDQKNFDRFIISFGKLEA